MDSRPAETTDELSEVFEIRDEQIDVAAIMAEIRARLRERRPLDVDLDALVFRPGGSAFASLEDEIRYYLDQARAGNERLMVGEQLRAERTRPIDPLRRVFHQLVQYYVDALGQRQRAVNADLLNATAALLHRITALAEEQQETISVLRAELERARSREATTAAEPPSHASRSGEAPAAPAGETDAARQTSPPRPSAGQDKAPAADENANDLSAPESPSA